MRVPPWLEFVGRPFPSANLVLIKGPRPILVDSGFGGDAPETERLLASLGVRPADLTLVVNTHYHSDHVGGNHRLQGGHGVRVGAHRFEADLVNSVDPQACLSAWLRQPVQPYRVDVALAEGDVLDTGEVRLQVLHTPGHTLGHICLYQEEDGVLILGDALHRDDVGWINPLREGMGALQRAIASVERLAELPVRWACSGHGPPIEDPAAAFAAALRRYRSWLGDPERMAWHGCKRILAFALIIEGGLPRADLARYLTESPWLRDYGRVVFSTSAEEFADRLVRELLRAGAARWDADVLVATIPHRPPPPGWPGGPAFPPEWPRARPVAPAETPVTGRGGDRRSGDLR